MILADQATDACLPSDAVPRKIDGFGERFQRRGAVQGAVRPVLIVVGLVGVQDAPQMVTRPKPDWADRAVIAALTRLRPRLFRCTGS